MCTKKCARKDGRPRIHTESGYPEFQCHVCGPSTTEVGIGSVLKYSVPRGGRRYAGSDGTVITSVNGSVRLKSEVGKFSICFCIAWA